MRMIIAIGILAISVGLFNVTVELRNIGYILQAEATRVHQVNHQ
jgi:uncharacterized membrane protein YiaA